MVHLSACALGVMRDERALFKDLTLTVGAGQLCRIEGPNGSGKTTLLRVLCGLISDYDGRVYWQGTPIEKARHAYAAALVYLGHRTGVKMALTPIENLQAFWGLSGYPASDLDERCWRALDAVGLAAFADLPVGQLSAGQQRRVALARLHLHEAPLWLLDEPFTAVDQSGVLELERWIRAHCERGGAVVLTSHQPLVELKPDLCVCLDGQGGHRVVI
ncbi:cytochrome c biogenesis heme-transporting ATPase CcmA [Zymobacter sp. IVIA_5232.4 C2]|uniref:cytochrome c biogenesis heme-transporting ATPase CcmA n=1 Tax=Zymobacter sp. IVIA_5232.4 C2 TaxID=3394855 RepID=UPI0039C0217C